MIYDKNKHKFAVGEGDILISVATTADKAKQLAAEILGISYEEIEYRLTKWMFITNDDSEIEKLVNHPTNNNYVES